VTEVAQTENSFLNSSNVTLIYVNRGYAQKVAADRGDESYEYALL